MSTEQPISVLDDLGKVQLVDSRSMLRLINDLPEQCETALGLGRSFSGGELAEPPSVILISGVGDSGTAAEMAAVAVGEFVGVPVVANRGTMLPKSVTGSALVVVVDYSGNSPSALRVYKEAKQRGAGLVCVTSGGKLREMATKDETRIVKIPPGQPSRTAIGYLFVPVVALFEQLGLAEGLIEKLSYGIRLMKSARESLRFDNLTSRNVAKQIALALVDGHVVIFDSHDYRSAVACRFKDQIAANGKTPAFVCSMPDFASGQISGWERARAGRIVGLVLKDPQDRSETPVLMEAVRGVLDGFRILDAEMRGATTIEKLLYGVYLADYVSYYLALASDVDPTPLDFAKQVEDRLTPVEGPQGLTPPQA